MNFKRFIVCVIAVFIFIVAFDYVFHGMALNDLHEKTKDVWRAKEEFKWPFIFLSEFLFSVFFTFLFTRNFEAKGIGEGLRFGLFIGLVLSSIEVGKYAYLPVPFILITAWIIGSIMQAIGAGILLSLIYKE